MASVETSSLLKALSKYLAILAVALFILLIVSSVRSYYRLAHIPGPVLARFTNIPRLSWVLSYRAHDIHTTLHRQYGPLVRFGPNMVSVADPAEVNTIYGFGKPWIKVSILSFFLLRELGDCFGHWATK